MPFYANPATTIYRSAPGNTSKGNLRPVTTLMGVILPAGGAA
jgi:hypothetical protein